MMTCLKTYRSMLAICVALAMLLLPAGLTNAQPQPSEAEAPPIAETSSNAEASSEAEAQAEAEAQVEALLLKLSLRAPDAEAVRVYDAPSDDGSAIIVEWLAPTEAETRANLSAAAEENDVDLTDAQADELTDRLLKKVVYQVEIARSAKDLTAGLFLTIAVDSDAGSLKSAEPKYFGFSRDNADYYYAAIVPAEVLATRAPEPLTVPQYQQFVLDGVAAHAIALEAAALKAAEERAADLAEDADEPSENAEPEQDAEWAFASVVTAANDDPQKFIAMANGGYAPAKPPEHRDFLRRISLYAAITQSIADGVLGEQDGQQAIAILADTRPEGELSPTDKARREWLAGVKLLLRLDDLVAEGYLTEKEADRVRSVLPLANLFAQDIAAATERAEADKKQADLAEQQARAAKQLAKQALADADDDARDQAKEAMRAAEADERQAKLTAKGAKSDMAWVKDRIRFDRPKNERRELDWFERLVADLERYDKDALTTENRRINEGTYYFRLAVSPPAVEDDEDSEDSAQAAEADEDDEEDYKVYVTVAGADGAMNKLVLSAAARTNGFKWFRMNNLVFSLVFSGIVLTFIQIARRNPNLFLRKIAGLDAVEEAIGRATEMGKPAFFVHGFGGPGDMPVIAALNILARVAKQAAIYDSRICVMNIDPIVTAISQEVVQQAYVEAGRPDAFDADDVAYMTNEQFSYAAAVAGRMVREKPAAIFLIGSFMAESLLLAETGASTGAIQIAGTEAEHQLPFFITTCDYTLIGEELYAASAYLSREPRMLGSLRGQDVGKAFMMVAIVLGVILLTVAAFLAAPEGQEGWLDNLAAWFKHLFEAIS